MNLLGLCFSVKTKKDTKQVVEDFFVSDKQNQIATVNSEMLLLSSKDAELKKVLCASDLVVADGSGVVYMSRLCPGVPVPERVTGNDILQMLFEIAEKNQKKIFFLGGEGDFVNSVSILEPLFLADFNSVFKAFGPGILFSFIPRRSSSVFPIPVVPARWVFI